MNEQNICFHSSNIYLIADVYTYVYAYGDARNTHIYTYIHIYTCARILKYIT